MEKIQIPSYSYYDEATYTYDHMPGAIANFRTAQGYLEGSLGRYTLKMICALECTLCSKRMIFPEGSDVAALAFVRQCPSCGFWMAECTTAADYQVDHKKLFVGKLMEYSEGTASVPLYDLCRYIKAHPERIFSLNPKSLERLVGEAFRNTGQYTDVIHVGQPADGGVDVVLVNADGQRILVQVKRRAEGKTEPVSTVRNLLGALVVENSLQGIIVSTADHFSYQAAKVSKKLRSNNLSYTIELKDLAKLREMISDTSVSHPWEDAILRALYRDDIDRSPDGHGW